MDDFREYTTRATKMWIENTAAEYFYYTNRAAEILKQTNGDKDKATEILAEEVKNNIEEHKPTDCSLYDDILTNALALVNYKEVAESILDF